MHLQTQEGTGPAADAQVNVLESLYSAKSTSLPFGQNVNLSSVSGPTYLTAQTLVQQVAYALSDKLFSYSPQSFDLDVAAKAWKLAGEKNAHGDVTGVQALDTRHGVGNIALGYMFSPDFNLNKRHVPQSIIASAGMLQHLRPALDQLSLLHEIANPTALQIAAVDYAGETRAGLVTDYCAALNMAEELGLSLIHI